MRRPFFGFALADATLREAHHRRLADALGRAGHAGARIVSRGGLCCAADGEAARDDRHVAYAGVLPDAAPGETGTRLLEFMRGAASGEVATADLPHGSFVAAYQEDASALHLATDGFGTMPLFVVPSEGGCWYSNDPKLLFDVGLTLALRPLSLVEGLHRLVPVPPLSHFEGMISLRSSRILRIDLARGSRRTHRYHRIEAVVDAPSYARHAARSVEEQERLYEEALDRAVARSVAPFRKVGLLLSGGVDSSLLACFGKRHADLVAVHIDQPGGASELEHAEGVARRLDIPLDVVDFTRDAFAKHFVTAIHEQAQPFFIANGMGLQHASRSGLFASADVLIDGEGADFTMLSSGIRTSSLWRLFSRARSGLPARLFDRAMDGRATLLRRFGYRVREAGRPGGLHDLLCARLVEDEEILARFGDLFAHVDDPAERDVAAQVLQGFESYLQNVLTRLDPASRVAGKHTVFPYLEPGYVSYVTNLPATFKLRRKAGLGLGMERKWLAKRVAARHLPASAIHRPKVGFGIPSGPWLQRFPAGLAQHSWVRGFFALSDGGFEHLLRTVGTSPDLFFLVSLEVWGRLFVRGDTVAETEAAFAG